jgi:hypothetical protein
MAGEVGFAATAALLLAGVSAWAGVRGRQQHEARRVNSGMTGPHDCHPAVLKRLAQRLERRTRELRELIE